MSEERETVPIYVKPLQAQLRYCGYGDKPSHEVAEAMNEHRWYTVNMKDWTAASVRKFVERYGAGSDAEAHVQEVKGSLQVHYGDQQ